MKAYFKNTMGAAAKKKAAENPAFLNAFSDPSNNPPAPKRAQKRKSQ
jgi:hypothetical protein